jgi:predicted DCC family thiol-disulfide oxidoreductase YuxK
MFLKWVGGENGWTGGQYSLVRFLFGAYLAVHFAHLAPWGPEVFSSAGVLPSTASPLFRLFPGVFWISDAPNFVVVVLLTGSLLAVLFALGVKDRFIAIVLWWLWASLFDRNPLISNPGLPYVGWMLLAHACLPQGPYGSIEGARRSDAGALWRFSQPLYLAAWLVLAAGYSYSGYTKLISPSWLDGTAVRYVLDSPLARPGFVRELLLGLPSPVLTALTYGALGLELLFLPLACFRRARPLLWGALLGLHFALIALVDFADLSLGMVMIHLFTFDPGWIPAKGGGRLTLFFDGSCGLCHRAVRFVLSEDRVGEVQFAPLGGTFFRERLPTFAVNAPFDSLILLTEDGRTLTSSSAVIEILERLGGIWRVLGALAVRVPQSLRDRVYRLVATNRRRLFATPVDACPLVPASLRGRFL